MTPINKFLPSFRFSWQNKRKLVKPILVDFTFFVLFIIVFYFFAMKWIDPLTIAISAGAKIGESTMQLQDLETDYTQIELIKAQQEILFSQYEKVMLYFLGMFLVIFILWIITQGYNWNYMHSWLSKKVSLKEYYKRFAAINIFFAVILFILFFLYAKAAVLSLSSVKLFSDTTLKYGFLAFLIVIDYCALFSYGIVDKYKAKELIKKSITVPFRKYKDLIPMYILAALTFILPYYAINYITQLFLLEPEYFAILLLIIYLPLSAWLRVYIIECCKNF